MTVAASANLADTIVLKAGNSFLVSLPDSDVPVDDEHPLGLYRDDCRFLSGARAPHRRRRAAAARERRRSPAPTPSTSSPTRSSSCPDGRSLALQTLQLRVDRTLEDETTMLERVHVHLYGREPVELELEVALAADFRPMLVLRGLVGASPEPAVRTSAVDGGLRFAARGADGVVRATTVTGEPAPAAAADGRLRFPLQLEPGHGSGRRAHDSICIRRRRAGRAGPRTRTDAIAHVRRACGRRADAHHGRRRAVHAAAGALDARPAHAPLPARRPDLLRCRNPVVRHAVRPRQPDHGDRDASPSTRRSPSRRCACSRSGSAARSTRSARRSRARCCTSCGSVRWPRSGSRHSPATTARSTPRRCSSACVAEHAEWTGTLDLFRELRPAVDAALGWIGRYGDHDSDGLLDYRASTPERPAQPGLEGFPRRHRRRARCAARAPDRRRRGAGLRRAGQAVDRAPVPARRRRRPRAMLLREADEMEQPAGALLAP